MSIFKTSLLSVVAIAIKTLSTVVINKAIALFIGPVGLALVGQFQNFLQLVMISAQGAITTGITKYTAEYGKKNLRLPKMLSTAFRISLVCSIVVGLCLWLFSQHFSLWLFETDDYFYIFIILSVSIIFFVVNNFLLAVLNGLREFKTWVFINISQSIIALLFTGSLVYYFGLAGGLIALVTNQSLVFLIALFLIRNHRVIVFKKFLSSFDTKEAKKLSSYAVMTLTSAVTVPTTQLIVRNYIGENISWEVAGHWQAVWYISTMYLNVFTTALGLYYLPKLSATTCARALKQIILSGYKFILPVAISAAVSIYFLKGMIVSILFSEEFQPATDIMLWQLVGDVVKMSSWLIAYLMVAKALKKHYVITELFISVAFILLTILFTKNHGVLGVPYAYTLAYSLYLIIVIFLTKRLWTDKAFQS